MKPRKYGNHKVVVDGLTFDSKAESRRWHELKLLEMAGHVRDIRRQVVIPLVPGVKLPGATRARPAIRLVVDFLYKDAAGWVHYEDCKGMETPVSLIKRHLAKALHGIDVEIVA